LVVGPSRITAGQHDQQQDAEHEPVYRLRNSARRGV
jgi:hypothetical protein